MNLDKTPGRKRLQPGDPYTFLMDEPIRIDFEDGEGVREARVGDVIGKWFSTDEPGRDFRITAISGTAYETVFLGFQHFAVRG